MPTALLQQAARLARVVMLQRPPWRAQWRATGAGMMRPMAGSPEDCGVGDGRQRVNTEGHSAQLLAAQMQPSQPGKQSTLHRSGIR